MEPLAILWMLTSKCQSWSCKKKNFLKSCYTCYTIALNSL